MILVEHASCFDDIETAIYNDSSHMDVANAFKRVMKDAIVYDDNIKKWYVCNKNNIWIESPSGVIVKSLLTNIMCRKFVGRAVYNNNLANKLKLTEDNKEKYKRRTDKNYNPYAVFRKIMNKDIIQEELRNSEYGVICKNSKAIGRWYV